MLKRDITFEDFDGNTVTETFYFNISKTELIELEVEHGQSLQSWLQKVQKEKDAKALVHEFKRIVLLAYGEKSDNGREFRKSDELSKNFSYTNAYSELFLELATDDEAAAKFIKGILPKDLVEESDQDKPTGPPKPPVKSQ